MTARANRNDRYGGWRYRANVAIRLLAAILGGYAVAALTAATLARMLPMPRVEAVITATMLSYLALPGVAVWAFLARGPWRALAGVAGLAALLALIAWTAGPPA